MKKRILLFLGLTVLMSILGTGCYNLGRQITLEKTVEYNENVDRISIDSNVGTVWVIPEERDDVYVVFQTYENGQELFVDAGDTIRIKTQMPFQFFNFRGSMNYRLYIHLPEDFAGEMDVDLTAGDLEMGDFDLAKLDLGMTSGDINVYQINTNEMSIDITSGDVQGSEIETDSIYLEMTSGDIVLNDVSFENMRMDVTSGSVELNGAQGAIEGDMTSGEIDVHYKNKMDDFIFDITSGEIRLDYSQVNVDANFDIEATSGDIRVDFDLDKVTKLDDDIVIGRVGEGVYDVRIDVTSGEVVITD